MQNKNILNQVVKKRYFVSLASAFCRSNYTCMKQYYKQYSFNSSSSTIHCINPKISIYEIETISVLPVSTFSSIGIWLLLFSFEKLTPLLWGLRELSRHGCTCSCRSWLCFLIDYNNPLVCSSLICASETRSYVYTWIYSLWLSELMSYSTVCNEVVMVEVLTSKVPFC
jgi:hypothetical protein